MKWIFVMLVFSLLLVGCSSEDIYEIEKCPPNAFCETFNVFNASVVTFNLSNMNVSTYTVVLA